MKVCIVSDSHDNRHLIAAAVADAKQRGAEAILHCGDVVAPSTLNCLREYELPIHVIHGNNAGDIEALSRRSHSSNSFYKYHGMDAAIELGGRKIFIVHYPHYGLGMAATGDYHLVCWGHDHVAMVDTVKNCNGTETHIVDPGSVAGLDGPATYVLGDLDLMRFEILNVPGGDDHHGDTPK